MELRVNVRTTNSAQPMTVTTMAIWPMSIVLSAAGGATTGSGARRSLPHWRLGPPAGRFAAALVRRVRLIIGGSFDLPARAEGWGGTHAFSAVVPWSSAGRTDP